MANLILTAASSVGGAVARAGIGAAIANAVSGTVASYAANVAERLIFGPKKRKISGPRLETFQVQASTEGAGVLRVYGRARIAGQVIWAARFKERLSETTETSGKGGRLGVKTTTTEYLYSISFAVGLCEGAIDRIGRVWADGKPFDVSPHAMRVHKGTEDQLPDALIEAVEGQGNAPAFRGLAYVVFEDLPLKEFGNRIPQLSFEIEKSLRQEDPEALENAVTALVMIPGSGEFFPGTTRVLRAAGEGVVVAENAHNSDGVADFAASLDQALAAFPNLKSVALVVAWFGTDLRAGECRLKPGVDAAAKATTPYDWRAGGVARENAHLISAPDGRASYGGTPADRAVLEAIAHLKARGLEVMFHPFILMDIPPGNALPDPYGGAEQARYPWRGRVTVGGADKTAAASSAIGAFFGAAEPAHFAAAGDHVAYSGPAEWSFRRMILHYARLCAMAGGVHSFLLGSELKGVTAARSAAGVYPAVAALKALAADVKSVLPAAGISYGADWSEYAGHKPGEAPGDLYFHLDPFWSDSNVAFVAIDAYFPLADWRAGATHQDALAGHAGPHDRAYLQANIEGGEFYDWYYASPEDRAAQARSPISDGAYGEAFVWRAKDVRGFWANAHFDRPGAVRAAAPTAWIPQSKPVVFAELGCPAVDKGANEPNVFYDPKSAESRLPQFSTGARDDLAQRRFIEAVAAYWRDPARNPLSSVYGGSMIDAARIHVYCWDARPYPFFPALTDVWGDGANWEKGHWLNGRAGRAPLDLLATALCAPAGVPAEARALKGVLSGYVLDRPLSPREAIEPLADIFQFDMVETTTGLRFQPRDGAAALVIGKDDLVARDDGAFAQALGEASALPAALRLGFLDEAADYAPAIAEARDARAGLAREVAIEAPLVLGEAEAAARARALLADAHVLRETASFALPPSHLAVEPGDVLVVEGEAETRRWRVVEISDHGERRVEAARLAPSVFEAPAGASALRPPPAAPSFGAPVFALMDLPLLGGEEAAGPRARLAAFADPWPGAVALYREGAGGPQFAGLAATRSVLGRLDAPLAPGFSGRFDHRPLYLRLSFGALASRSEAEILGGANALAVETAGGFEVLQFSGAALQVDGAWRLSGLLRGQGGTEDLAALGAPSGARCVLLSAAQAEIAYPRAIAGAPSSWQAGPESDLPDTENFTAQNVTLRLRAERPYAPAHLAARAEAGGIALSWIRRTRIGGDGFDGEVPLGEAFERYRVAIFDGAGEKRAVEVAAPSFFYTAAMIGEDFGGALPATAAFEVRQLSETVGAGAPAQRGLG